VLSYLATCALVAGIFSSGEVTGRDVSTLLGCYGCFVATVLVADV